MNRPAGRGSLLKISLTWRTAFHIVSTFKSKFLPFLSIQRRDNDEKDTEIGHGGVCAGTGCFHVGRGRDQGIAFGQAVWPGLPPDDHHGGSEAGGEARQGGGSWGRQSFLVHLPVERRDERCPDFGQ